MGFSAGRRVAQKVFGAVCRRFESCRARPFTRPPPKPESALATQGRPVGFEVVLLREHRSHSHGRLEDEEGPVSDNVSRGEQAADEVARRWMATMQSMGDQLLRQQQTFQQICPNSGWSRHKPNSRLSSR